ncbi:MAG: VOC family protein [Pseudomonadota bacterium]
MHGQSLGRRPRWAGWIMVGVIATVASGILAESPKFDPLDSLSPGTSRAEALALPLQTVTLSTASIEQVRLFYVEGMGMTLSGPIAVPDATKQQQRALWEIPDAIDWQEYHLTRPDATISGRPAMSVRVLALDTPTPTIHASWNSLSLGGFSMGFPNRRQPELDKRIRKLGFGALNALEIYDVPRTDGTTYTIHETIFNAPDFVHAVGIDRLGMLPLGAVDTETGLGGPGYSAQVVLDSDKVLAFYLDVLGLELRRDDVWQSAGEDGAMDLPNGTAFRFSIVFAKGYGPGGHLLFVDYTDGEAIANNAPARVPNRGIGMWSFPVTDLAEVARRATDFGARIVHQPVTIEDPLHGLVHAMTVLAPNGFLVELYEAAP